MYHRGYESGLNIQMQTPCINYGLDPSCKLERHHNSSVEEQRYWHEGEFWIASLGILRVNWDSHVPLRQREKGFPSQYWEFLLHCWECVNWDSLVHTIKTWKEILISLLRMREWKLLHPNEERDSDAPLRQRENGFPSHYWEFSLYDWEYVNFDSRIPAEKAWIEIHTDSRFSLHHWVNWDSLENTIENAWIKILALASRKRESRFPHSGWESVNWNSRLTIENIWIKILALQLRKRELRFKTT